MKEKISYCTITKNKAGQYYCTLMVEKEIEPLPQTDKVVGIDLGIKTLVVDSINHNTRQFPEIRLRMPCWIGETSRCIWRDVENWDEHIKKPHYPPDAYDVPGVYPINSSEAR